ncbi:hypothetical protein L249_7731 [Ophiocordyceps polyrhachis-furcata BCC 54312]|uniref:Uncharacterized protein n=1 Tax=Ophiocordyceps polyrhachis-furcata BCC 54312 TaxID=1330021 RepID=A0A367LAU2_9HYPO|nr:hypothetical protein L249_7731 [Ophiocordyceps polyrhachis-furcata BCC 54312]
MQAVYTSFKSSPWLRFLLLPRGEKRSPVGGHNIMLSNKERKFILTFDWKYIRDDNATMHKKLWNLY